MNLLLILICQMVALVRRALAEVCTVPVVLVLHYNSNLRDEPTVISAMFAALVLLHNADLILGDRPQFLSGQKIPKISCKWLTWRRVTQPNSAVYQKSKTNLSSADYYFLFRRAPTTTLRDIFFHKFLPPSPEK